MLLKILFIVFISVLLIAAASLATITVIALKLMIDCIKEDAENIQRELDIEDIEDMKIDELLTES